MKSVSLKISLNKYNIMTYMCWMKQLFYFDLHITPNLFRKELKD